MSQTKQAVAVLIERRPDCITATLSVGATVYGGDYPKGEIGVSMAIQELAECAGVDPASCYATFSGD